MASLTQIVCLKCNGLGVVKKGEKRVKDSNKCPYCNGTGIDPKHQGKGATK